MTLYIRSENQVMVFVCFHLLLAVLQFFSVSCYGLQKKTSVATMDTNGILSSTLWKASWRHLASIIQLGVQSCWLKNSSLGVKSQISWSIRFVYGNSCVLDITEASPKFYGSFNNTMSVLGKHSIEMTAVYLAKSYCSPSLTYGCEVWNTSIGQSALHKVNVVWSACMLPTQIMWIL